MEDISYALINIILEIIRRAKVLCSNISYKALTVSTDISLGSDHIFSVIAIEVYMVRGIDIITYVICFENIELPSEEYIKKTTITYNFGYIAKIVNMKKDKNMSVTRNDLSYKLEINEAVYKKVEVETFLKNKTIYMTIFLFSTLQLGLITHEEIFNS